VVAAPHRAARDACHPPWPLITIGSGLPGRVIVTVQPYGSPVARDAAVALRVVLASGRLVVGRQLSARTSGGFTGSAAD